MPDQSDLEGAIRGVADPMVVMQRLVDQALVLIPQAEGAVVELVDGGFLTYVCAGGNLARHVGTRLRVEASLSGAAVRTGETLRCDDTTTDGRVDREACLRVGAISMVCVPLRRDGEPVGALKVSAARARAFDDDDVITLSRVANFITAAIAGAADLERATNDLFSSETARRQGWGRDREFVANVLQPGIVMNVTMRQRVERVLAGPAFTMVCQPVIRLADGNVAGVEALARFHALPQQSPDVWFADARRAGLGVELELAAVAMALRLLAELPATAYLAINVGPEAVRTAEFAELLDTIDSTRVVIELTEHLQIDDYVGLHHALAPLRARGARLAIDDTGSGFAGLAHMLKLAPDIIKLDRDITTGIDVDPVRRALAGALVNFAADTEASVIAEGIETTGELHTARQLGVGYGQGFLLGRPGPIASVPRSLKAYLRAG